MSVESFYIIEGEGLVAKLEKLGILKLKTPGTDTNSSKYLVDLKKACPEMYEKDIAEIKKRGIWCIGRPNYGQKDFLRNEWKIKNMLPGYVFSHYSFDKNREAIGYYIQPKNDECYRTEGRTLVCFKQEERRIIKENGDRYDAMWKLKHDTTNEWRRDLTDKEIENLQFYEVYVYPGKDNEIHWIRNYATAYDEGVIDYVSKALPEETLHIQGSIEGDLLFDNYIKDGQDIIINTGKAV